MMSQILERAVAPVVVTMIWIVAILLLVRGDTGGVAPLISGLMAGTALVLQAWIGGERELARVFPLRAPTSAALAFVAFLAGSALAASLSREALGSLFFVFGDLPLTLGAVAAFLMRLGTALALAAILAEAALRLIDGARA
ncbi:MAG: hypothetical protein U1E87_05665 [Alphaproteobacteria bacterium]